MNKWDTRFLALAEHVACWSKDPSTKVGAVIVDARKRVVSLGYNGFPRGIKDTDERLNNRDVRYKMTVHAERNAILFAARELAGSTIYVHPFMPCAPCAGEVIQAGITRCVAPRNDNPRWAADFLLTEEMFKEAGVELELAEPVLVSDWLIPIKEGTNVD